MLCLARESVEIKRTLHWGFIPFWIRVCLFRRIHNVTVNGSKSQWGNHLGTFFVNHVYCINHLDTGLKVTFPNLQKTKIGQEINLEVTKSLQDNLDKPLKMADTI